jgi:ribosomal protein S18 acetylase RimI-like enzyme
LIYRKAEQHDKEGIKEVLAKSFEPTYAYYAQKSFANLHNALVAEDGGKVIGVINWRFFKVGQKKIGYLFWLAVQPEFRRMGVAKSLIRNATGEIQQEIGFGDIFAAVEKDNIPSRNLLESFSFTLISRAAMKKKFGSRRFRLYFRMMLLPKEDLFINRSLPVRE